MKNPGMPPWQEVRGLTAVGQARFDFVIGTSRDREFFLIVPVHVSEDHGETAVRVSNPTVKSRDDILSSREFGSVGM